MTSQETKKLTERLRKLSDESKQDIADRTVKAPDRLKDKIKNDIKKSR